MKKNNNGFSLVELIIVIAIMAVLIGLLAPQYLRFVEKSKKSADVSNAQALATAYNVAFADGLISQTTVTLNKGSVDSIANVTGPECKLDSTKTSWAIVIGSNGVSDVKVGGASGTSLYPSATGSWQ